MSAPLLDEVMAYIDRHGGGQGLFPTPIDAFNILTSCEARLPMRQVYRPSLCIVLQGAKEITLFGEEALRYGTMQCLVVSLDVPASGRIVEASPEAPYVGLTLELDFATLREVVAQIDMPAPASTHSEPCIFISEVGAPLADCIARLVRMCETPEAIPVLYPSVVREIFYWLLSGPNGADLCNLALPESNTERVVRAIYLLQSDYAKTLRIEQLAAAARMSTSSFHHHFKAMTSMTPLQYQKQLRLLQARRMMVADAVSVSEAAYEVGYESASQFSREYSRMFGSAPKRDVMNLQRVYSEFTDRKAHVDASSTGTV